MPKLKKSFTAKQQKFIDEYLKDLNATQACIRAGFSKRNAGKIGFQLLGKTRIKQEIEKKQQKLEKKSELTHEWVVEQLKKVFSRCMQEEAVYDRDGNFTGVYEFEASGANRSIELIGKHLGTFAERVKLGGDDMSPPVKVDNVSVDYINERLTKILKK